jgi:hypothetical protein
MGAEAEMTTDTGRLEGELLLVDDVGILLLVDGEVVRAPWSVVSRLDIRRRPGSMELDGSVPPEADRRRAQLSSRDPYGLDAEQLEALLASLGQEQVREVLDRAPDPDLEAFVQQATESTLPFRSRAAAIRAGYRRLGADFPGMGEHWVHPVLAIRGEIDAAHPPVLSYVEIDDEPVLVGLAFTVPLGPDDEPPAEPFGTHAFHDHSGNVDEETLLLNHPGSMHNGGSRYRLSMVHVWTGAENPDGLLAQNNWTLPWLRAGLTPPAGADREAARGVSLGYGGRAFYAELLSRAARLTAEEEAAIGAVLDRSASRVEGLVAAAAAAGGAAEPEAFAGAWRELWRAVREAVSAEAWAGLAGLAGEARAGQAPM